MNRRKFKIREKGVLLVMALSMLAAIVACNDDLTSELLNPGLLELSIGAIEVTDENGRVSNFSNGRTETINTDTWEVTIVNNDLGETSVVFPDFADAPPQVELLAGNYTIFVDSDNEVPAGFGDSFATFAGSQDFVITDGSVTSVQVSAAPTNARVSVEYTVQTRTDFDEAQVRVSTPNEGGLLIYNYAQTEFGYFTLDSEIQIDALLFFTRADGVRDSRRVRGTIPNPLAGSSFTVTIDANLENGSGGIEILVVDDYTESSATFNNVEEPNANFVPGGVYINPETGSRYQTVSIQVGPSVDDIQVWFVEDFRDPTESPFERVSSLGAFYYTQNAAINETPEGCHLPTEDDWQLLNTALGPQVTTSVFEGGITGLELIHTGYFQFRTNGLTSFNVNAYYWSSTMGNNNIRLGATFRRGAPIISVSNFDSNDLMRVRYLVDLR